MSTTTIDFIDEHDGQKTREGYKFTRKAIVEDMLDDEGDTDEVRLYNAINDDGIPNIGDAHPAIANCLCESINAEAIEPSYIVLNIVYSTKLLSLHIGVGDPAEISMESSLTQDETSKDKDGNNFDDLIYTYKAGTLNPWNPKEGNLAEDIIMPPQLPRVTTFYASRIYMVRKTVSLSEAQLETLNQTYQGKVNLTIWRGYSVRTWVCLGLSWFSIDRGDSFILTYRFQYRAKNYDREVFFRDENNAKIPADAINNATQPNASRTRDNNNAYRVLGEANFNNLDLS